MNINVAKKDHKIAVLPWSVVIKDEMTAVEERLRDAINSAVPTAFELSQHLIDAGGKRLRPALVVLSAKASGNPDPQRMATIASCCEMIHMATLVHDDVIDGTDSRRGRPTANAFWGNKVSVLSGDFLLSKSFALLSLDGDVRVLREVSQMTVVMSESEVLQAICEGSLTAWQENYWNIITGKTAGFMSTCCRLGATITDADEKIVEALGEYGRNIGMAFQLTDDLLDITGDPTETGKPVGTDIKEGKTTLPVLIALTDSDDATRGTLLGLLNASSLTVDDIDTICQTVRRSGAIEKVREEASKCVEKGIESLRILPDSEAKDALETIARSLIDRCC